MTVMLLTLGATMVGGFANATSPLAITCGATLTRDAYLAADLSCPTGDGVVVAASLSIDLRGHHLRGGKSGTGVVIRNTVSLQISHGRLDGWMAGIAIVPFGSVDYQNLPQITITAVNFMRNTYGVELGPFGDPQRITLYRSWFQSNFYGIGGPAAPIGTIKIWDTTFRNNIYGISVDSKGVGPTETVLNVQDSEFSGNRNAGVSCFAYDCTVTDSKFLENGDGIVASQQNAHLVLRASTMSGNTQDDVDVHAGANAQILGNTLTRDVVFLSSGSALVSENTISGGGIEVGDENPTPTFPTPIIEIIGNKVSGGQGINTDGTISVEIGNNLSTDGAQFGIYVAVSRYQFGDPDLGGNRAYGNSRNPQCIGVVCSS